MRRRVAVLIGLVASSMLLGGCVVFSVVPTATQQDVVGKLRLTLTFCASEENDVPDPPEDHPGCPEDGNDDDSIFRYGTAGVDYQLLFALRVPVGTGVPATISATPGPTPPAAGTIAARRSASYEAALQAAVPAAAGSQWVGYASDPYPFDDGAEGVPAQSAVATVDLDLPRSTDGAPFVGQFPVRPVVGARMVDPGTDLSAERPVDCGTDPTAIDTASFTICIDSPTPGPGYNQLGSDLTYPTRDFGIVAGNATASAGQTVSLPFGVRGAGALPAGLTASLTASTTLPGASVTPSVASAPLSNGSDTRVTVPVAIPANAAAGTYEVALTGRLDNGQERRGVAQLTVRPRPVTPDTGKPRASKASVRPRRFKAATRRKPKRGTDVRFTLSEAASVRLTVERCAKRAGRRKRGRCLRFKALKGSLTRQGVAGANRLRFDGRLRGRPLKPGAYRLVVTPTDAAGNRGAAAKLGFAIAR